MPKETTTTKPRPLPRLPSQSCSLPQSRCLLFFALAALALGGSGCSELDNCPEAQPAVVIESGTTDSQSLIYSSSPWEGPRDWFPAKTCMHFVHGLGTTPEFVNSYVSFASENSDVTENAGNQGRIKCVDDYEIIIKNDTCEEDFFIRVAAFASGTADTPVPCADRSPHPCDAE